MKKLKVGDLAPKIKCKNQDGEIIKLSDFLGKKIVIFFYPRANTPGCTTQACNLGDNYIEFKKRGYEIIGVSADNQKSQKNFSTKYNLPFNLCCDEDKKIINDYGVWGLKKFRGNEYMGIIRTTFIIDKEGKIEEIIEKVKTKEHSLQILQ